MIEPLMQLPRIPKRIVGLLSICLVKKAGSLRGTAMINISKPLFSTQAGQINRILSAYNSW